MPYSTVEEVPEEIRNKPGFKGLMNGEPWFEEDTKRAEANETARDSPSFTAPKEKPKPAAKPKPTKKKVR
jgi:hypothetical protein